MHDRPVHEKNNVERSSHLIGVSWSSADMLRRSLRGQVAEKLIPQIGPTSGPENAPGTAASSGGWIAFVSGSTTWHQRQASTGPWVLASIPVFTWEMAFTRAG